MQVTLKDFQADAVAKLHSRLEQMRSVYESQGVLSSVCLSSVTGSGKTVMCAAVIEALFFGNDELGLAPDPRACVLWVTDSPSLNDQTRARFVTASDRLASWPGDNRVLEDVGNTFCASHERLSPRHVYFLSKDLLGRGNKLVSGSEENSGRVFWDVLDRTIKDPAVNLYLFVDEAHRGFGTNQSNGRSENTIYANLVNGFKGRAPMPMVVGVSATPARFEARMDSMKERDRKARVEVLPEVVQESGLIKDTVELRVPEESDPVEHQYLTMAAERFAACRHAWDAYCREQGEPYVFPLMLVQVRDGISPDKIKEICDQICAVVPGLDEANSFANVFGEHKDLAAGRYLLPYIKPENVQATQYVQVLFAKEAISNGWDCPRAEVLFSQRNRKDPTYIAQLIGRMVRTPLARRIDADDSLNSIACYLPQFNGETSQAVVDYLTGKTDVMGGTAVPNVNPRPVSVAPAAPRTQEDYAREQAAYEAAERARKEAERSMPGYQFELSDFFGAGYTEPNEPHQQQLPVVQTGESGSAGTPLQDADMPSAFGCPDAPESIFKPIPMAPPKPPTERDRSFTPDEWKGIRTAFESIPVRRNPKKARNEFTALLNTATLFMDTGIDKEADDKVNDGFASELAGALIACGHDAKTVRRSIEETNTRLIVINKREGNTVSETDEVAIVDDEGIERASRDADPVFGGKQLTNAYRKRERLINKESKREVDLRLATACKTVSVVERMTTWAKSLRSQFFQTGSTEYDFLSERYKQRYRDLEGETDGRLVTKIQWPSEGYIEDADESYPKHIVQREDGLCPLSLNDDEKAVVKRELARERTVAFYRNPSNMSPQVFSIPYTAPDGRKAVHPDFIFFVRDEDGVIRPSIIDPHGSFLSDAVPKLRGYIEYLREYPDVFKQVLAVDGFGTGENRRYRSLNLLRPEVQEAIMSFTGDSAEELYRSDVARDYC
ncbi:DEAD/DEAH box helicase [Enorma massiliensis]|uniref:DEAD/DEAH box helicase n=1 Tax=Enorma massiliensis TaxID=1472761 RepID=UPI003AF007FF